MTLFLLKGFQMAKCAQWELSSEPLPLPTWGQDGCAIPQTVREAGKHSSPSLSENNECTCSQPKHLEPEGFLDPLA